MRNPSPHLMVRFDCQIGLSLLRFGTRLNYMCLIALFGFQLQAQSISPPLGSSVTTDYSKGTLDNEVFQSADPTHPDVRSSSAIQRARVEV